MKLQSVGLGFGSKSNKSESEKSSSIFLCALGGSTLGATAGVVARNYAPASDEFFHQVSTSSSDKKQDLEETVSNFIDEYSAVEVEDARVLKTVLQQPDIKAQKPQINSTGIKELLQDDTLRPISESDSAESRNAVKALHTQLLQEIKEAKDKKSLPEKFEALSQVAKDNLDKAKKAVFVRENLSKYKGQLRGLSDSGKKNIAEVQEHIEKTAEGTPEMRKELSDAFMSMVRTAKKSQRPVEFWAVLPGIVCGILGMGISVNYRLQKEYSKTKKEPQKK